MKLIIFTDNYQTLHICTMQGYTQHVLQDSKLHRTFRRGMYAHVLIHILIHNYMVPSTVLNMGRLIRGHHDD